jgi:hypothetical protein
MGLKNCELARSVWLVLKRNYVPHCLRKWMLKRLFLFARELPVIEKNIMFYTSLEMISFITVQLLKNLILIL